MEAASVLWRPLGELFVSRGLISEAELEKALAEQAATGKRLGEILVERGLVSSPDLTSALMDQLGVEISKEEGFGSGLWAEIKRRHRRSLRDDEPEGAEDESGGSPEIPLAPPVVVPIAAAQEPAAVDRRLEAELQEIRADYTPPAEREPAPEPEPEPEFFEPEPQPQPFVEAWEPVVAPEPVAEDGEVAELRAQLAAAREDLAHLQEMLGDAMTALTALTAEAVGEQYAGE